MNIYKEIEQIVALNKRRTKLISSLESKGIETDGLDFDRAYTIEGCIEKDGHLYSNVGNRLDNSGLVDNDYYCCQFTGYLEDDYYGTIYFATDERDIFVAIPFEM